MAFCVFLFLMHPFRDVVLIKAHPVQVAIHLRRILLKAHPYMVVLPFKAHLDPGASFLQHPPATTRFSFQTISLPTHHIYLPPAKTPHSPASFQVMTNPPPSSSAMKPIYPTSIPIPSSSAVKPSSIVYPIKSSNGTAPSTPISPPKTPLPSASTSYSPSSRINGTSPPIATYTGGAATAKLNLASGIAGAGVMGLVALML